MGRRNSRWMPSPVTGALVAGAFSLVGNLATNTVEVSWRWWPVATWVMAAALLAGAARVEVIGRRSPVDGSQGSVADPGARVFGAIPQPAWHWQDRPHEMRSLRKALGGKGRAALVALPGQRGAGKSQLAAAHARRCVADGYELVAWINAESSPVTGLVSLAEHLGLSSAGATEQAPEKPEDLAAAVRRWLERDDKGRRLVVFDNVDDPDALTPFLPSTGTTKVVITTNRREFTTMAGVTPVDVGMFTQEQGLKFLHEATGLAVADDAVEVGRQLGWLPLGLAQAAAYINLNKVSFPAYLAALDAESLDETLACQAGADHPGVLKATQLSLTALRHDDRSGDAVRLVTVLSLLSPDGISRALLIRAEESLGLKHGVRRALRVLATASLITIAGPDPDTHSGDAGVVTVHRLTARVIRHHAGKRLANAIDTTAQMLDVLTGDIPRHQVAHRRGEIDELVAHILTLHGHTDSNPSPLLLKQCNWAGLALSEVGDLTRSTPILEATLADYERVLGSDHPDTLSSRNNLAYAYQAVGRVGDAVELFERTLGDCERVLGPDHPLTVTVRENLDHARRARGEG